MQEHNGKRRFAARFAALVHGGGEPKGSNKYVI